MKCLHGGDNSYFGLGRGGIVPDLFTHAHVCTFFSVGPTFFFLPFFILSYLGTYHDSILAHGI